MNLKERLEKFKEWFKTAGLRSFGWAGASIGSYLLLKWGFLSGIFLGVFFTDNWVTIRTIIKEKVDKI